MKLVGAAHILIRQIQLIINPKTKKPSWTLRMARAIPWIPELQDRSIVVKGYLNGDPNQSFFFTSDLDEEQEREFLQQRDGDLNPALFVSRNKNPRSRRRIDTLFKRYPKKAKLPEDSGIS